MLLFSTLHIRLRGKENPDLIKQDVLCVPIDGAVRGGIRLAGNLRMAQCLNIIENVDETDIPLEDIQKFIFDHTRARGPKAAPRDHLHRVRS